MVSTNLYVHLFLGEMIYHLTWFDKILTSIFFNWVVQPNLVKIYMLYKESGQNMSDQAPKFPSPKPLAREPPHAWHECRPKCPGNVTHGSTIDFEVMERLQGRLVWSFWCSCDWCKGYAQVGKKSHFFFVLERCRDFRGVANLSEGGWGEFYVLTFWILGKTASWQVC